MPGVLEIAQRLIAREPNRSKRTLLQEQFIQEPRPAQVVGLSRSLQGHASLYYRQPRKNHTFDPVGDLRRHYECSDDWYFYTGLLRGPEGEPLFSYTVTFNAHSLGTSDTAVESVVVVLTSLKDGWVLALPPVTYPAGAVAMSVAPFRFEFPGGRFSLTSRGESLFPLRLRVETEQASMDLVLESPFDEARPLFHSRGEPNGYLGFGGMGWFYYSYPQLRTTGTVRVDGQTYRVSGTSWMDRQFGTVGQFPSLGARALAALLYLFGPPRKELAGWIWACFMLADGRTSVALAAPVFSVDGEVDHAESVRTFYAVLQHPDGRSEALSGKPLTIELTWSTGGSKETGTDGRYVSRARIRDVEGEVDLVSAALAPHALTAFIDNRRLPVAECPTEVTGSLRGQRVSGIGFLETVGAHEKVRNFSSALELANVPCTPENVRSLSEADWRSAQVRGWSTLLIAGLTAAFSWGLFAILMQG